ncbi:MAG TPA: pyruvate dehydrogenase (acetyl-transferring) E1 component subunit alpha [Polyangiaceae bacterium]|nr:pyruvate dehydrogenase (acetyl-transferring) E1 component subunit alpha [Polyangiaceae bacterium]
MSSETPSRASSISEIAGAGESQKLAGDWGSATMSTPQWKGCYRAMLLIRRIEEEAARAYSQGKIGGFLHLYIGQEAIAVGTEAALEKTDYMITTYRDHGIALARGCSARSVMAELYGKDTGLVRGLGGSMHLFDVEHRVLGGHAIVGGHVPLAAGIAFRARYLGENAVTVCFLGDGATNIGGFHEGLSLAGLWRLPVIYVCENNRYSMGTPLTRTTPLTDLTLKAPGYGMASDRFEGHDVLVVRERMLQAVERARSGGGPTLIEVMTYRFRGHSMSDPGTYRTAEELDQFKRTADPCRVARDALLQAGTTEAELSELEASVESEVQDAVQFAEDSAPARETSIDAYVLAPARPAASG